MVYFIRWGSTAPRLQSHYKEAVYFLPREDERLRQPWSQPVLLNTGPLDRESIALTTRPLLHKSIYLCKQQEDRKRCEFCSKLTIKTLE